MFAPHVICFFSALKLSTLSIGRVYIQQNSIPCGIAYRIANRLNGSSPFSTSKEPYLLFYSIQRIDDVKDRIMWHVGLRAIPFTVCSAPSQISNIHFHFRLVLGTLIPQFIVVCQMFVFMFFCGCFFF